MKSIFVSSTFKDMQYERDFMQSDIIPELNKFAMEFGEQLRFVDLRWGVNTSDLESDEGANKVLSVCLDEIDNCNPYMIIILGERYGWVPDKKHLLYCTQSKNYELDDVNKSVTALEIEYGALSEKSKSENCLFFIRDNSFIQNIPESERGVYESESEESLLKLNNLKKRLEENFPDRVFHYSPKWDTEKNSLILPDDFKEDMVNGVKSMVQDDFEKISGLNVIERNEVVANLVFEEKQAQFSTRFDLAQSITKKIENDKERLFIIKGEPGSGRSSLAAQIAKHLADDGVSTNIFVAQTGSQTGDTFSLLKHFTYNLQKLLMLEISEPQNYEQAEMLFEELLFAYGEKNMPLHVFTIVNSDAFYDSEEILKFKFLPQNPPFNVKFLFVFDRETYYRIPLGLREFAHETEIEMLNDVQKAEMINGILAANAKELDENVIASIIRKKGTELPLYIYLIIQRLLIFDIDDFEKIKKMGNDMNAISKYMCRVVDTASDDIDGLAFELVFEIAQKINFDTTFQTIILIALSVDGLRQTDIESVMNKEGEVYSAVDTSRLFLYMDKMLKTGPNGEISFAYPFYHKRIVQYSEDQKMTGPVLQSIFEHLKELDICDPFRISEILKYATLLYDYDFMQDYIEKACTSENSEILESAVEQLIFLHYFDDNYEDFSKNLFQASKEHFNEYYLIILYQRMIETLIENDNVKNNNFILFITQFLLNQLSDMGCLDLSCEEGAFLSQKEYIICFYGSFLMAAKLNAIDPLVSEKIKEVYDEKLTQMCISGIDSDNYVEQALAYWFMYNVIRFAIEFGYIEVLDKNSDRYIDFSKTEFERTKDPQFANNALNIMCEVAKYYSDYGKDEQYEHAVLKLRDALEFGENLKVNGEVLPEYQAMTVLLYQTAVFIFEVKGENSKEILEFSEKSIELLIKENSEHNNAQSIEALADMYLSKGIQFHSAENFELAIKEFLKAKEYFTEVLYLNLNPLGHYNLAQSCNFLADCYMQQKNHEQALHHYEASFEHGVKFYELINNSYMHLQMIIGTVREAFDFCYSNKNYEQTIIWLERYTEYLQKHAQAYDFSEHTSYSDSLYVYSSLFEKLEDIVKNTKYKSARHTKKELKKSMRLLEKKQKKYRKNNV